MPLLWKELILEDGRDGKFRIQASQIKTLIGRKETFPKELSTFEFLKIALYSGEVVVDSALVYKKEKKL